MHHELANLTTLSSILASTEQRCARPFSDVDGNRTVKRRQDGPANSADYMLDGTGQDDAW